MRRNFELGVFLGHESEVNGGAMYTACEGEEKLCTIEKKKERKEMHAAAIADKKTRRGDLVRYATSYNGQLDRGSFSWCRF